MGRSIRLILASPPHTSCQVLADAAAELDVFCINSFQCYSDQISPLTGTLLTWHHSPDKLSPISCAQGDVACQANSYMLIHETSSQTGPRSQKSQQERPMWILRPEMLPEGQGLPVKTQLAVLYKTHKLFHQSSRSLQHTTALQAAMGPRSLAVPKAHILPDPCTQGPRCWFSSLGPGAPQTHTSGKVVSFLEGWQGEETSSVWTTIFSIGSAETTQLFFNWK